MKINITLEEVISKVNESLKLKIKHSVDLLQKSEKIAIKYDNENGFWLAFSGGKDSQALYHITQLANVKFKAHFSPTSVDPPQLIKFIKTHYAEVDIIPPSNSIYKEAINKCFLPTGLARWCCAVYKEIHGAGKATLTGIRRAESTRRSKRNEVETSSQKFSGDLDGFEQFSIKEISKKYKNLNIDQFSEDKEQEIRCINGKDKIIINPIIDWTEDDVWEFLKAIEVPHCELYDAPYNFKRIGCILCPMANTKSQVEELKYFPYVKTKWLEAIKEIRKVRKDKKYKIWNLLPPDYSEEELNTINIYDASQIDLSEDEICEYIFQWWLSKKNYKKWYAETFCKD